MLLYVCCDSSLPLLLLNTVLERICGTHGIPLDSDMYLKTCFCGNHCRTCDVVLTCRKGGLDRSRRRWVVKRDGSSQGSRGEPAGRTAGEGGRRHGAGEPALSRGSMFHSCRFCAKYEGSKCDRVVHSVASFGSFCSPCLQATFCTTPTTLS